MIVVDAQLPPVIATWIQQQFGVEAVPVRDLGLREAEDRVVFVYARERGAVVMTTDSDFVTLLLRHGAPPQIIWLTCGNTSNAALRVILARALPDALKLLERGEPLVEIA